LLGGCSRSRISRSGKISGGLFYEGRINRFILISVPCHLYPSSPNDTTNPHSLSAVVPLATIKRYNAPPRNNTLLNSTRFSEIKQNLCTPVSTAKFTGTWIRTFVLLWLHGGAYCLGHALGNCTTLLRVSELIAEKTPDTSLAIFSVEYTLGPEARFPTQQREALAAYRYLLDRGIAPERIVVGGVSAGGHLGDFLSTGGSRGGPREAARRLPSLSVGQSTERVAVV
jgi:hypothetical protein